MIKLIPIRTIHAEYAYAEKLLTTSFPPEEYRNLEEWKRYTIEKPAFHNSLITADDRPIGLFTYWDFKDFKYGEHFAIDPALRNGGYGRAALQEICQQLELPIIIEVELPDNDLAKRRIAFYQRQGFTLWEKSYLQPPYQPHYPSLPMYLMAYGPISETRFEEITRSIHREVYGMNI